MHRRHLLQAGAALLAAPAIARAQSARPLRFIPYADLALLDPAVSAFVTRNHVMMVFDTLFAPDADMVPRHQMLAGHAVEPDGLLWTLTLREGLLFHDDTPVLARDCVASIERWESNDPFGQNVRAVTDELSAVSDRVFRFRLRKPFPLLTTALAKPSSYCPVMPERLARTAPDVQVTEMVGSGPFRFLANERVSGSRAVYERFAGYVPRPDGTASFVAGPKRAHVDRVVWHTIPDAATAAAALQQGEVDWWEQPTGDLLPLLRGDKGLVVAPKDPGGSMSMIRFNCLQPPFDNPAIRRAFFAGVRQSDYMRSVMGDDRTLWNDRCGFFLPGGPLSTDAGLSVFDGAPDYAKVKANLQAAGYKGERVVFVVPTDLASLNAFSEVAADMFRHAGVNLDYQASDWGTVAGRLANKGPLDKGGWSVWCNNIPGIIAVTPATQSYIRGIGAAGTFGWPTSPRIEALRDRFLDATTPDEQKRLTREIQLQAFQDVPYVPLGAFRQPFAWRTALSGMLDSFPVFWNIRKA